MDVNTAQKVNDLAKELVQKGLAASLDDASSMAQRMMKDELKKDELPQQWSEVSKAGNSTEQLEIMLERNNRKIGYEITAVRDEVKSLKNLIEMFRNEIGYIKKDLKGLKLGGGEVVEEVKVEKEVEVGKREAKVEEQKVLSEEKRAPPKNQDFTPEDVSVEKMFYFGKK